jgi:hypothetical protein
VRGAMLNNRISYVLSLDLAQADEIAVKNFVKGVLCQIDANLA